MNRKTNYNSFLPLLTLFKKTLCPVMIPIIFDKQYVVWEIVGFPWAIFWSFMHVFGVVS